MPGECLTRADLRTHPVRESPPHPTLSARGEGFWSPSLDGRGKGEGENFLRLLTATRHISALRG